MSVQVADTILCNGFEHSFVDSSTGSFIFHPQEYGVALCWTNTSNWRGFYAQYTLPENELTLNRLFAGRCGNEMPELLGIQPIPYREGTKRFMGIPLPWTGWSEYNLYELDAVIPFTGGILLGKEWLRPSYWTSHSIQYYGTVHELIFDHGLLQQGYDCSEAVGAFRDGLKSGNLTKDLEPIPDGPSADMDDWDERTAILERQDAIKQQHKQRILDAFDQCFQLKYKPHWI